MTKPIALIFLLTGCSALVSAPGGDDLGPSGGKVDENGTPVELAQGYAAHLVITAVERNGETGAVEQRDTVVTALVRVLPAQEGASAGSHLFGLGLCRADIPPFLGRKPTVSDDVIQSGPESLFNVVATQTADGEVTLVGDPAAMQLGVRLDDPRTDSMPTDAKDPRIYDDDEDRSLGISLEVGIAWVYGAFRGRFTLDGTIGADGSASGSILAPHIDVGIYGDSIPFYDGAGAFYESREPIEIVREEGSFKLIPLDANTLDCPSAIAQF